MIAAEDASMLKQLLDLRKDIDKHFAILDRLLEVARDKEEEFDFPIAFVTNVLYVCSKNDIDYILNYDKYLSLLLKKQDNLHLEGISHAAYALDYMGVHQGDIWEALH